MHQFTYALYPHAGDHVEGKVAHAAYMLNIPLQATVTDAHSRVAPASASLVQVDAPNVIVEAVKRAEDGAGIVVRLYESTGASASAHVHRQRRNLRRTDQSGRNDRRAARCQRKTALRSDFHPFEIQTVRVK